MSVILTESNYTILRNNDPSWQAMTRVSDANNVYDVRQEYVKRGNVRNDFKTQLNLFDNNKGLLNDGTYIDLTQFFMDTTKVSDKEIKSVSVPYFKFKTNAVINSKYINCGTVRTNDKNCYKNEISDTYITKKHFYSVTSLNSTVDPETNTVIQHFGDKQILEKDISSFPLQRVDKLVINEFASLFIYVNGLKIPDNEVFVYSNKMYTDVFIPKKYIPGNIYDDISNIDCVFTIDYRQSGSECLYHHGKINGSSITIDLTDSQYKYDDHRDLEIVKEKILAFVNGEEFIVDSIIKDGNLLTLNFPVSFVSGDLEFYILNDVIYRYKVPTITHVDKNTNKLHFYINDDYKVDIISGPITKSALSFFYDGKRVDDSKIIQTSRFSFEYSITETDFDENKVDFFIEDIGKKVDDKAYSSYGDDYYLLNMLGVRRCVDRMRGHLTYSIFDDIKYQTSFKEVLSKNGDLFDVQKAIDKYDKLKLERNTATSRAKELIVERPTLLRRLMEQWKNPSKRFLVYGNAEDVKVTSVSKIENVEQNIDYKIYVNHQLIDFTKYTTVREVDIDYITIDKSCFNPLVQDETGKYISGVNTVEIFQFDLTYREKSIYRANLSEFSELGYDEEGNKVYSKRFTYDQLPFGDRFLTDDICAIEQVCKKWYDSTQDEYYLVYPTKDNIGYRMVKKFYITNRDETGLTINIQLHEAEKTEGYFFILIKQYNVIEEIIYSNIDQSYMIDNDLIIPVYSKYIVYNHTTKLDKNGNLYDELTGVNEVIDFIPYINNSEPIISKNGFELIYGKDYTFINPEKNNAIASSFIVLKAQPTTNDIFTVQFNSTKTNILIVGYDDLVINNRYGLIYLSELKYPVSTEYMNIFINGNKMSAYDIDILSDKLIRVHNITRPIRTILITTNLLYKESEIQDYIDLYKPTTFEKLLEEIFWNCDPSKHNEANKPNVDFVYKMNPYYSDFVGDDEENYSNPYYKEYTDYIIAHGYDILPTDNFEDIIQRPSKSEEEKYDAWKKAKIFFEAYKGNHGFVTDVDSVKQIENPEESKESENAFTDTLELMYINWLANSGKTRTQGFKDLNIDPIVLKYFSVFENVVINDKLDIVIDANRCYDGMMPDVTNPIKEVNVVNGTVKHIYPGSTIDLRRSFFYMILLDTFDNSEDDLIIDSETGEDKLVQAMCRNKLSNILYPIDFPLSPDKKGIKWTGTDVDIVNFDYGWNSEILEDACEKVLMIKAREYVEDCSILKYLGIRYILNKIYPLKYEYNMDFDAEDGYYASIENALIKFLSSKDGLGDNLDSVQYDTYKALAKRKAKELINIIYPNTFKL